MLKIKSVKTSKGISVKIYTLEIIPSKYTRYTVRVLVDKCKWCMYDLLYTESDNYVRQ